MFVARPAIDAEWVWNRFRPFSIFSFRCFSAICIFSLLPNGWLRFSVIGRQRGAIRAEFLIWSKEWALGITTIIIIIVICTDEILCVGCDRCSQWIRRERRKGQWWSHRTANRCQPVPTNIIFDEFTVRLATGISFELKSLIVLGHIV